MKCLGQTQFYVTELKMKLKLTLVETENDTKAKTVTDTESITESENDLLQKVKPKTKNESISSHTVFYVTELKIHPKLTNLPILKTIQKLEP